MLVGRPPFYDRTRDRILENISNGKLLIPKDIPYQARHLIISLLQRDPKTRISIEHIKQHPYFEDIDWNDVATKDICPQEIILNNRPRSAST